jgi:coproporphyrinogen III oxidase-like Fe-S oxidoreductase
MTRAKNKKSFEDLSGFQDFIDETRKEIQVKESLKESKNPKNFDQKAFLSHDEIRLKKLKDLFEKKIPFMNKFNQGDTIIKKQNEEILHFKKNIFQLTDQADSPFRKSLREIFDRFF